MKRIPKTSPNPKPHIFQNIIKHKQEDVSQTSFQPRRAMPNHSTCHSSRNTSFIQMNRCIGNQGVQQFLTDSKKFNLSNDEITVSEGRNHVIAEVIKNDLTSRIENQAGQGDSLDDKTRLKLEYGIGEDLRDVKIHANTEADYLADSFATRALTYGSDIFFRNGCYLPHQKDGFQLLAHEITHVAQQHQNPIASIPGSSGPLSTSHPSDSHEQEANRASKNLAVGKRVNVQSVPTATVSLDGDERPWWQQALNTASNVAGSLAPVAQMAEMATRYSTLPSGFGSVLSTAGETAGATRPGAGLGVASNVASGIGTALNLYNTITAPTRLDAVQSGADTLASAAGFFGPVGSAFSGGYSVGSLIAEHTQADEALGDGMFDVLGPGPGLWLADTFGL